MDTTLINSDSDSEEQKEAPSADMLLPDIDMALDGCKKPVTLEPHNKERLLFLDYQILCNSYYRRHFNLPIADVPNCQKIRLAYLHGLHWVSLYYHMGCPSWSWYVKSM